jgi:SPP1 gp7 family putative phage head morphogenesis protein
MGKSEFSLFSDEEEELFLLSVWSTTITKEHLSYSYHEKVGIKLEDGLERGFGKFSDLQVNTPEYETYLKLRKNIYHFSAAKQYQQVRRMSDFITKNGEQSDYKEFKTQASEVFNSYNKNYLKTEYSTAIGQGQNARQWVKAVSERKTFPVLEYRTQRDSHVRDEHASLDGIRRPVKDPFWNTFMPKNGWNCRCFVVQHEDEETTNLAGRDLSDLDDEKKFPPEFRMNPGKDGLVFDPSIHPYFRVAHGDGYLKKLNFNLPD